MHRFELAAPRTLEEAAAALREGAVLKGGGIDLIDRMKEGLATPARVVTLTAASSREIGSAADGALEIGAGATIAQVAASPLVRERHPALAAAARETATPQVRSQATIAGNLLQRSRCLYFRLADFQCRKRGGEHCPAIAGRHEYCGVHATDLCPAVHPSNLAVPLVAAGAELVISRAGAVRSETLESIFVAPTEDVTREHRLETSDIVVSIRLPAGLRATGYHEVRQRQGADWALVSAAVGVELDGRTVRAARAVLGFVAPAPHREPAVESALLGKEIDAALARKAAALALADAAPLPGTRYKLPMARAALGRAILAAGGESR